VALQQVRKEALFKSKVYRMTLLIALGSIVLGYLLGYGVGKNEGYIKARLDVAEECRRLGKFFVGKTVFTCTHIEDKPRKENVK
jgi:hypothetical protein